MKAYSTDLRCKLVQAYERHLGSQRALTDVFGVSHSFVKKVLRRYRMTSQLAPKPHVGSQKPRLDAAAHAVLRDLVGPQPDSTLEGIRSGCENLSLVVTSLSVVPCRHGHTSGIIIRPLGADPTRSAGLYSGA